MEASFHGLTVEVMGRVDSFKATIFRRGLRLRRAVVMGLNVTTDMEDYLELIHVVLTFAGRRILHLSYRNEAYRWY